MLHYNNPLYPHYFADPFVWLADGVYYAIGTGAAEALGAEPERSDDRVFPLLRSRDLVSWESAGFALERVDPSWGDTYWAPEVAFHEGTYYLYYSVGHSDRFHQIRVATSTRPLGPYRDCAQLTDPAHVSFAIDPHPFRDDDGRWYLFHARDFLDLATDEHGTVRAGTALVVAELEGMTRLKGGVHTVLRARFDWQLFAAQRSMYGELYDWHTLEGPFVIKDQGRYYCLYSGGCWQSETYGVDYTVADHVLGPYEPHNPEAMPRVLRTAAGRVIGPGHCSVIDAPDASSRLIVYHAWDPAMTARRLCIDPLRFTGQGLRAEGPS